MRQDAIPPQLSRLPTAKLVAARQEFIISSCCCDVAVSAHACAPRGPLSHAPRPRLNPASVRMTVSSPKTCPGDSAAC